MMRFSIPSAAIAAAFVLGLWSGVAIAQSSNTLTILQQGSGNTLTVDQSGASGSRVGGLEISDPQAQEFFREINRTVPVLDPDGTVRSEQETEIVSEIVKVVDFTLDGEPALQKGNDNRAIVNITGDGGFVGLLQDNEGLGTEGNFTRVSLDGSGRAIVGQEGDDNRAGLRVSGLNALGSILQKGSGNDARLTVSGYEAFGSISQVGNSNASTLEVQGTAGSSVSYTLNGNNVTNVNPAQGVEVVTNAQNVTITQTAITGR